MDRLTDEQIGKMWAQHYPQRVRKDSALLLKALVNIIKGNTLINAHKAAEDYSKTLQVSLQHCSVPTDQFWEIEELSTSSNV